MKSLNHDTRHLSRHDSDDKKWQTMRTPRLLCCFIFLTAKQHKTRTIWVENRAYSSWTIKSGDFSGRQFGRFLHDRRQILVGRFYWQTKSANFIVRLTSPLDYVLSGGGYHNSFLLSRLGAAFTEHVPRGVDIERGCDADTVVDFKEAVVFAFLGLRCLLGLVNVDSAVTGAGVDTISGAVHLGGADGAAGRPALHDDMRANLRRSSNAVALRDSSQQQVPP